MEDNCLNEKVSGKANLIGVIMIILLVSGLFLFATMVSGLVPTCLIFAGTAAIVIYVGVAIHLLNM